MPGQPTPIWLLVIGTIPGAIVGFLFERFIESTWRNPTFAAAMIR
jgi:undecaprenyl pyrophosphate phosphatase UppP